jgi:hypothetical protein
MSNIWMEWKGDWLLFIHIVAWMFQDHPHQTKGCDETKCLEQWY